MKKDENVGVVKIESNFEIEAVYALPCPGCCGSSLNSVEGKHPCYGCFNNGV